MGVKGLYSYVKPYRNHVDYSSIPHGSKIGVDALSVLYHYRGNTDAVLKFLVHLQDLGCKILFVFDGPAPESKAFELEERQKRRDEARSQIVSIREFLQTAHTLDERSRITLERKVAQLEIGSAWHVTTEKRKAFQEQLWAHEIQSVKAQGEADDLLVSLWQKGHLYSVISTDMDFLVHGIERLWVPTGEAFEELSRKTILEREELTSKQFLEASILCSIVSSQTAFQWIRYYGSLENLLKFQPQLCKLSESYINLKIHEYTKESEPRVKEKHVFFLEKFLMN